MNSAHPKVVTYLYFTLTPNVAMAQQIYNFLSLKKFFFPFKNFPHRLGFIVLNVTSKSFTQWGWIWFLEAVKSNSEPRMVKREVKLGKITIP